MDPLTFIRDGMRRYILTLIHEPSRAASAVGVASLSSRKTATF